MKDFGSAYIERIARVIAQFHGETAIAEDGETIAANRGYGSFNHSVRIYTENHWREYARAAEAVLNLVKEELIEDDN